MGMDAHRMGTKRVLPLLMSMAVPPMVSMLIQSMYNIVDSFFVAKMGKDALTAVSLAFPMQNIVLALAVGLGVGVNSCIARSLGAKDEKAIRSCTAHGVLLCAVHSLLLIVIGLFLSGPFISMFTENEAVRVMGTQYSQIVICLSFGSLFHILIEKMFQSVGNMVIPMLLQGLGAIINIILDPILIFGKLGFPAMGVRGAAVATVIGQITACLAAVLLFRRSRAVPISFKGFRFDWKVVKSLYSIALPSSLMMAMPSLLVSVLNGVLVTISQSGVAVFGIYYKLQTFVYMPASGLVQGMRPIIGYNYGAKKYTRVKQTLIWSVAVTGAIMLLGTILSFAIPEQILLLFEADAEMLGIGVDALRIISCGFVVSTVGIIISGAFEALGKGGRSLTVSLLRQLLIIPPLALLFARFMGLNGVWATFPVAEMIAAAVAVILLARMRLFQTDSLSD